MADERTYPCLPCPEIDDSIAFYESLGFRRTYRQVRPNPYAVVSRDDLQVHLFGIDGFDPAKSYGCAIVAVPDPDALYEAFAAGLRQRYGKLPAAGIPRIGRPRKRYGTVRGFSVVDPGGNWLRVSKLGAAEDDSSTPNAKRYRVSRGSVVGGLASRHAGIRASAPSAAASEESAMLRDPHKSEAVRRTCDN